MRRRILLFVKKVIESLPGLPEVEKDSNGNTTSFESTEEFELTDETSVDTGFIPFDGNNFELHLNATFSYYDNANVEYPTILNALQETPPYNGFLIRYEGSQLYLVHQSTH